MKGRAQILNQSRSDLRVASAGGVCLPQAPPASNSSKTSTAAAVGQKVLAGLAKGRQRAALLVQARVRALEEAVVVLAEADIAKGHRAWGRAGRIQRKMGSNISERHVKRILDRLSGRSDLEAHTGTQSTGGHTHAQ